MTPRLAPPTGAYLIDGDGFKRVDVDGAPIARVHVLTDGSWTAIDCRTHDRTEGLTEDAALQWITAIALQITISRPSVLEHTT